MKTQMRIWKFEKLAEQMAVDSQFEPPDWTWDSRIEAVQMTMVMFFS